jgi:hypothetical protein
VDKIYKIYKLINPFNEQIFYIGMTKHTLNWRLDKHHYKSNWKTNPNKMKILTDIKSKGSVAKIELIEENLTLNEACCKEEFYIKKFKQEGYPLVNIKINQIDNLFNFVGLKGKDNPMFGKNHSEKTRKKMSNNRRDKKNICQYNLNEELIKIFSSSYSAAEDMYNRNFTNNKDIKSIASCIGKRCREKDFENHLYGFKWKFEEQK